MLKTLRESPKHANVISSATTMTTIHRRSVRCGTPQKLPIQRRYEKKLRINNNFIKISTFVLLTVNLVKFVECSETKIDNSELDSSFNGIIEKGRSVLSDVYSNGTFTTGNSLWDNILNQCTVKPSVACLQKNVFSYLDESLGFNGDINVTEGVCFKKNNVDIDKYSKEANIIYLKGSADNKEDMEAGRELDEENAIEDEDDEAETPFEEVTDALYDKSIKFLVTHDMKLTMPEIFFHGATLRVSPRALTKTGALVHIDLEPKVNDNGQGRIFFHKIKKYLRKKLVMAAIAIILVVKLIVLKLLFVLPIIFGVTTAKKMFLKLLLFLFPALSHIFKLCSWYHQNYHTTKFHHHHHLITHHHHKPPHAPVYGPPSSHPHSSVAVSHPHHESPSFEHYPQDWELSGPGLGSEFIASDIHRNAISNFKPHVNDMNDINSWGLGAPPGQSMNIGEISSASNNHPTNVLAGNGARPNFAPGRPSGPQANQFHRNKKITHKDPEKEALIRAAALAARAPPSPVRDEVLRVSNAKLAENTRLRTESELVRQQQEILAAEDPDTIAAEKFYAPLLDRIDKILSPMGAVDPGCRERAVCVLYRDPFGHTPYSNLVSNELSKESSELIPPADSKIALRYYRYVQAARDGQEQNDCITLYPNCNFNYGKKK